MSFADSVVNAVRADTRTTIALAVLTAGALAAPQFLGTHYTRILTSIFILGYFGIVFNWAFGHANLPAFGHAAFFGLGAYGFGMSLEMFPGSVIIPAVAGIILATMYSVLVAIFSVRGKGIYFALLTFAFAEFLHTLFFRLTDLTGGNNGLILIIPEFLGVALTQPTHVYYLSLVLVGGVLLFGYRLLESPYGRVLYAIHYNEERARSIGYPVKRVKISIFVLTAALSSIAGILFALNNQFISPSVLGMQMSIDVLIVTIIGGSATLAGPLVGAAFIVVLEEIVSDLANVGIVIIGIIFILTILIIPGGVVGEIKKRMGR
jgi:branched-chain amino acid transport system permease protein